MVSLFEITDPDVAEAERGAGVAVGLEFDGGSVEGFVERGADVARLAFEFEVILHQDAVEEDGDVGRGLQAAVGVEGGRGPGDIVGLPFAGLAVRVGERDGLLVDAAGLSVDVGLVVEVVEDLEFVSGVAGAGGGEKDSAVAAGLSGAGDAFGDSPLDVELIVLEAAFGLDVAGGFFDGDDAVVDGPLGGRVAVLRGDPLVEILAVEQDDRVRGRGGWGCAGRDDFGLGRPDFRVFGLGGGLGLGLLRDERGAESEEKECDQGSSAHDGEQDTPESVLRKFGRDRRR